MIKVNITPEPQGNFTFILKDNYDVEYMYDKKNNTLHRLSGDYELKDGDIFLCSGHEVRFSNNLSPEYIVSLI